MNRYLYILFMWLCSLSVLAQTEGYNPNNPPLPNFPDEDTTYVLTAYSSPYGCGSLTISKSKLKAGETAYLIASNKDNHYFMYWIDDEGRTLTTSKGLEYTMPKRDVVLTAVYKYVPESPQLPDFPEVITKYKLSLGTKPADAGSFNINNVEFRAGESIRLYAYNNEYFHFERWEDEQGNIVSTAKNFYYRMPAADTRLYAIYTYNPSNPKNPNANIYDEFTGELILDDFIVGDIGSAAREATNGDPSVVTSLTVAGYIDENDLQYICRNFTSCSVLDLSRVGSVGVLPSNFCYSLPNLNRLYLPRCHDIREHAFSGANSLTEITINEPVPPIIYNTLSLTPNIKAIYVPASSVELYKTQKQWAMYDADGKFVDGGEGWSRYEGLIQPIQDRVSSLEVNLPTECADGRYKNMPLELLNVKSGQRFRYVVTDRINYTFTDLVSNTRYVATLKNLSGQVLAKTDTISVGAEDVSVTFDFAEMKQPRSVGATVFTDDGTDVTSDCVFTWYDENNTFLSQGSTLDGRVSETKVKCGVALSQTLAMSYCLPEDVLHEVVEGDNKVSFTLVPLPTMQIEGRVLDVTTQQPVNNANITVSQTLNGKYSKSFSGKTDIKGAYSMTVFVAPSTVTYAADDYVSQKAELADSVFVDGAGTLADVKLKPITGATIATKFTYTTSVASGVEPEVQHHYAYYLNVDYNIYNVTAQRGVSQYNVQHPNIVLLEDVNQGDSLRITVRSKTNAFTDIVVGGRFDDALHMDIDVPIVQLGGIDAIFTTTENSEVLAILYDSNGRFVNRYSYDGASLSIRELADGEYRLVTMGASNFFGSVYNIDNFAEAGLQKNIDYIEDMVTVKSGVISPLKNVLVPFFDESKFYYTGNNTSFSVNKTSIVAGNYLTLTAKIDFKDVYKASISDVKVIVELPEGTNMVDNSVMVGSSVAYYELNGNTLTIPLDNNVSSDRVRFCVIPTQSGVYSPNATVAFKLNDKSLSQPMGSVYYTVENLSISVPSMINNPEITVTGISSSKANVVVYANGNVLGTTTALANGFWYLTTELNDPYNLQEYEIYAEVTTNEGLFVKTETQTCQYNKLSVVPKTVRMSFFNAYLRKNIEVLYDLEHQSANATSYSFYKGTDFTFTANLSNNDTTVVKAVTIGVYTNNEGWIDLEAEYVETIDRWVAVRYFDQDNLPTGVRVDVEAASPLLIDARYLSDFRKQFTALMDESSRIMSEIDAISKDDCTPEEYAERLKSTVGELYDTSSFPTYAEISSWSDEELDRRLSELGEPDITVEELEADIERLRNLMTSENDFTIDSGNGIILKSCSSAGLTVEKLLEMGFEECPITDGNIYVLRSGDKHVMVDFAQDLYIEITNGSELFAMARAIDVSIDDVEYWTNWFNEKIENINGYYQKFLDLYNRTEQALGDMPTLFQKLSEATGRKLEGAYLEYYIQQSKIHRLEAELADLVIGSAEYKATKAAIEACNKNAGEAGKLINALNGKISYAKWAVKLTKPMQGIFKRAIPLAKYGGYIYDGIKYINRYQNLYLMIPNPCKDDQARADEYKNKCFTQAIACEGLVLSKVGVDIMADISLIYGLATTPITGGVSALNALGLALFNLGFGYMYDEVISKEIDGMTYQLKFNIDGLRCKVKPKKIVCKKCGREECICKPQPATPPILDPSGYVYEGVPSNRLSGVTATCYYKEIVEDMYGDLHENVVLWNAEEYAQKNPLFTDENGMYAWDVPQGLWQVRFEKEGYVPTQSKWLPVPPPQMDVNVAMVQNVQPDVVAARAYEDGVEIEFSKYMDIESLNSGNIYLKVKGGGKETLITDAEIVMLNREASVEGSAVDYASRMKLATDTLGYYDEAYVIVSTGVKSYAGIPMAHTYEQRLDIEKKVRDLLVEAEFNVGYKGQKEITIAAIPADVAVGKKLTVVSASDIIATTDVQEVTFDADGQATITVNGELYGTTAINFSLADAGLNATSLINVVDPNKLEAVKTPKASRVSGTSVYRGQTVALSCESEGATIYYTTDGSCPCDESKRTKYERPIAINDAMTIKFMAVGANYDESDVMECTYSIRQSDVKLSLAKGWNWNSHDVASPVDVNEFSGVASRILTQSDEVIDDPQLGFVGSLTTIDGSETMKIEAKESATKSFAGEQYNPTLSPITLHEGWNWLGYPIGQTMTLADALSYMDAEEGDCISNLEGGFATYTDEGWVGSLETMTPGAGYLYKSAISKSFIYNNVPTVVNAKAIYGHRLVPKSIPWSVDKHRYPNLMPIIAQVCYSDGSAADSTYYVGVFVDDECRGLGKYSDGIMFLSVYGDKSADMYFKAWNVETGSVCDFAETLKFNADVVGTYSAPYRLTLSSDPTGINYVNADNGINGINGIYNMQGIKMDSIPGRGIYIIRTTDENGNSVMKKIFVK